MKIGRNDPCHCGSGKKYKKCCLEVDQTAKVEKDILKRDMSTPTFNLMTYEEVNDDSTEEIIRKLAEIGIPFNEEDFLQDVEKFYSAEDVSESWFSDYDVQAPGRTEDFPWLAACVLWERLAPSENLSMEQLDDQAEEGYEQLENNNYVQASDVWLQFWEDLQYRVNPKYTTLDYLNEHYRGCFFVSNVVQDLNHALEMAGRENPCYYEKLIEFCRSFCTLFPDEELIYHNMRRSIAEAYSKLGQVDKAEKEFVQLIEEVPDNPWGYIGFGDLLMDVKKEFTRAEELYKQAIPFSKTHPFGDEMAVKERLDDVKQVQSK